VVTLVSSNREEIVDREKYQGINVPARKLSINPRKNAPNGMYSKSGKICPRKTVLPTNQEKAAQIQYPT
jgi:hypothetical protein